MNTLRTNLQYFSDNTILVICVLMASSLVVRMHLYPHGIPLALDALNAYFLYASDTSILGHFPQGLANNGWPAFLSVFFSIFHFDTSIGYMDLQRIISISISVLTIIPVYYFGRRFFDKSYAILGAVIFAFEPRLIQNSLLGITEPLFIFLIAISLALFFSSNRKSTYLSFIAMGLSSLVRSEGLFLFFAIFVLFLIQYRKDGWSLILKASKVIGIFVLTVLPMSIVRIMINGNDTLTGRIISEGKKIATASASDTVKSDIFFHFVTIFENPIKFLGWASIPIFVFFVPLSVVLILKDKNRKNLQLILITIFMLMPAFYALSQASDTRYILPLYPLFSVLSLYMVRKLLDKIRAKNSFLVLIVCGILISSSVFLILKGVDLAHEREAFEIAKYTSRSKAISDYNPESQYVRVTPFVDKPLTLSSLLWRGPITFETNGYQSLQEFIDKNRKNGLDYIVVDDKPNRPAFLNDVFHNDQKYIYLEKTFDSSDYGYKYHVKMYKINYDMYNSMK